jgi:uncharacterized tellurite resistance protein B-like protein
MLSSRSNFSEVLMLSKLKALLSPSEPHSEVSPEERLQLATCVLLTEAALADEEFSAAERDHIADTLATRYGLSAEEAHDLIDEAVHARKRSNDLWYFTNQINQVCTMEEKHRIVEETWRVIYADGTLDAHEDFLVHKVSRLFNMTHGMLIDAKLRVLEEMRGT